eukprot:365271-Chlamydomonas_euryale.AAC.9
MIPATFNSSSRTYLVRYWRSAGFLFSLRRFGLHWLIIFFGLSLVFSLHRAWGPAGDAQLGVECSAVHRRTIVRGFSRVTPASGISSFTFVTYKLADAGRHDVVLVCCLEHVITSKYSSQTRKMSSSAPCAARCVGVALLLSRRACKCPTLPHRCLMFAVLHLASRAPVAPLSRPG